VVFNIFIKTLLDIVIWTTSENMKEDHNNYMVIKPESTLRKPVYCFEGVHIVSINVWKS